MQTIHDQESPLFYKRQVAQRFDRAAATYNTYGEFQQIVLNRLAGMLPIHQASSVLDLGTGTGRALPILSSALSPELLLAVDLSNQMLSQARISQQQSSGKAMSAFVCADAESLPFAEGSIELAFSSLALQWCLHPNVLFDGLLRILKPGGYLVFSTLCKGSMPEIHHAWQKVDNESRVNQYTSSDDVYRQVRSSGFDEVSIHVETITMSFHSPEQAIHSINKVGAGLVADAKTPISPSRWKAFLQQYERLRAPCGIPLSYQVAFVVAQKPF